MGTGSGRWVVKRDVELVELAELDLLDEVAEVDVGVSFGLSLDLG